MKAKIKSIDWLKYSLVILLALNLIYMAGISASASSAQQRIPDSQVIMNYQNAEKRHDSVGAAIWAAIYLDRENPAAKKNTQFWNNLQRNRDTAWSNASNDQSLAAEVRDVQRWNVINGCISEAGVPFSRGTQSNPPSTLNPLGPPPDTLYVYKDFDFSNEWMALPVGNYYTPEIMEMPNDSISSLWVGSNVHVFLCANGGLTGVCQAFDSNQKIANLSNTNIGNDQVTSIRVELVPPPPEKACIPGDDQIVLFMNFDFQAPCQKLEISDYSNFYQFNLPNDSISSIRVGRNVHATLCDLENFGGACDNFYADDANISENTIGNDRVSSLRVQRNP